MVTKKQFKKTLNKKHKKFNLTKKNKKQYRTKTRLNKLKNVSSGGAAQLPVVLPHSGAIPNIVKQLETNNLYTIIDKYKSLIDEYKSLIDLIEDKKTAKKKKLEGDLNNLIGNINLNLYHQLKMYIENLYKSNPKSFQNVIKTNLNNNYEHILPITNNDKDNMFLIFDYFKSQMTQKENPLTPKDMGEFFENSFIGGEKNHTITYATKPNFHKELTKFFEYIKTNDIYENYIKNRLDSLRKNMNEIIVLLNTKPLEEGEFRVEVTKTEIQEFYKTQKIPSLKYSLNYLVKDYIHYLFTYETLYHTILTPKIENEKDTINWQIVLENILEVLNDKDLNIMKSIFEYLKKVMMNATEIIKGSPEGSVLTQMTPKSISPMITPHFFPHLTDNIRTQKDQQNSLEITNFFQGLFLYIQDSAKSNIESSVEDIKKLIEEAAKAKEDAAKAKEEAAANASVSLTRKKAVKKTKAAPKAAPKATSAINSPYNSNNEFFNLVKEEEEAAAKAKEDAAKAKEDAAKAKAKEDAAKAKAKAAKAKADADADAEHAGNSPNNNNRIINLVKEAEEAEKIAKAKAKA